MEKSKKQYFNEINIMRGMAVLCVVIGHSFNPTETPTILGFIKSFVYCFHMPAFFFISGFLEGEKRRSISEKKQAIVKKAKRLMVPYFFLTVVTAVLKLLFGAFARNPLNYSTLAVDVPNALNWFREKHSAFHHMYYILWQHWAWLWVKHSGIHFDVIHHVTMNDYRIPSELYKAKGAKVIWGPMGGAQVTPRPLKVYEKNQLVASFREFVNKSCSWNPFYKKALRSYYKIYCINNETQKQISRIVGKDVPLMPELALRDEYKNLPIRKGNNDILKIVFVGRLIGKKE